MSEYVSSGTPSIKKRDSNINFYVVALLRVSNIVKCRYRIAVNLITYFNIIYTALHLYHKHLDLHVVNVEPSQTLHSNILRLLRIGQTHVNLTLLPIPGRTHRTDRN